MKTRLWVFGVLILLAAVQCLYYYPKLPDNVPCHFGSVEGSKKVLVAFYAGTIILLTSLFGSFSLLHIPMGKDGKDEWDAPKDTGTENKGNPFYLVLGVLTQLWIMGIFQLTFRANVRGSRELEGEWLLLGIYLFGVIVLMIWIIRKVPRRSWKGWNRK